MATVEIENVEEMDTIIHLDKKGDIKEVYCGGTMDKFEVHDSPRLELINRRGWKVIEFFVSDGGADDHPVSDNQQDAWCYRWVHGPDCRMRRQWYWC